MRTELKYLIPTELLPLLRTRIGPFVRSDPKAAGEPWPEYVVRSIYFDTPNLRYYHEKTAGLRNRKKLRIRGYDTPSPDALVYLEIKRKVNMGVAKDRAPLWFRDVGRILTDPDVTAYIDPERKRARAVVEAKHFYYYLHRYNMRPSILVVYNREPYVGRIDPGLRLTFDKQLRSAIHPHVDELFREKGLRLCFPGKTVMEVKFNGSFPFWLRSVLVEYGLYKEAVSKYVRCLDSHGAVVGERTAHGKRYYRPHPARNVVRPTF